MPADVSSVDINELLRASQGLTLDIAGKQFALTGNRQSVIADRKFDETDLIQAAAAKELSKAGITTDLAGMRPPALPNVT